MQNYELYGELNDKGHKSVFNLWWLVDRYGYLFDQRSNWIDF